jgi:ABC-type transport system involved in multi-copper enzyme maturation permease subunit
MKWRSSDMVALPLVARELRVAARRPRTYYGRMLAAGILLAVTLNVLLATHTVGLGKRDGLALFQSISGALLVWALISAFAGADSISAEKREGTIGFLFLTDLKSHDIVLGKMAAAALPAFYRALAALPMLAICMLMGGVTAAQYAKTGLAILNVFFLGQAVGMFSSAFCRLRGNAMGLPFLIFLVYLAYFACMAALAEFMGWRRLADFIWLNNPARPFYLAWSVFFTRGGAASGYWLSLLITNLHAWIFLALASWVLPRRWREKHKKASVWKTWWERWRYGSMAARTAFRRRLVSVNPFLWLMCRRRLSPVFGWCIMGGFAALMALCACAIYSDESWSETCAGYFVWMIVSVQLMLRMGVPAHAALLEEHRRNGSLEIMLCCTPMSVDDILDGMWLVLRRYYLWPALVLVTLEGLMFIAALIMGLRHSVDMNLLCFIVVSTILLLADLRAMAWMALWGSMSNRRPRSAGPSAFFLICMFPWMLVGICYATPWIRSEFWLWILWPLFALVNDAIACRLAQNALRKNFRLWAVPSYGEVLGFWGRAGRRLGLIRRQRRQTKQT